MDQISDQLHSKIHSLETMFLDTDDLLWEVNHKAYQDEPAVMKKVNDDLKTNFSQLRKKVIDISKLMKGYIDSDVITENVAVKFMKYMAKKHNKKAPNSHDISLTEVLDFLNSENKIRDMKKNEKQVFKNAEMLNSFLLSKHFEFNNNDSASELYKKSKNSFEKTVKNAIGLSNFISSFGQIISSKLFNSKELATIKAEPRKTKDVSPKKSKSISFELYQIPSKNKTATSSQGNSFDNDDRTLKTGQIPENKAALDTGIVSSEKEDKNEEIEDMPSVQDLIKERNQRIELDKKRFPHKKISFKISDKERLQNHTQEEMDVNSQTPQEMEVVDENGNVSVQTDQNPVDIESQTHLNPQDSQSMASLDHKISEPQESHVTDNQIHESQITMDEEDNELNVDHFDLEASPISHLDNPDQNSKHSEDHDHEDIHNNSDMQDLGMDQEVHVEKPSHLLDTEEGDFDPNDPEEIQQLDKEEARLKRLEKLGYPKVEQIDLEAKKPLNSYGLKSMSLTSSVKKFDGNPDASNAYKTLNVVMAKPFQEIKQEFQASQENADDQNHDVEMVDPQTHMNTYGSSLEELDNRKKERRLRLVQEPSYQMMKQNYLNQLSLNKERKLRQVQMNMIPYVPLKRNYSDKDMFKKKSFLSQKELNYRAPVPRNLLDNISKPKSAHHYKNLKQKTDEMYDNMLKMRF